MENLNAEKIKKALEFCKSPKLTKCDGCPREQEDGHCMYRLNEDALSLINSQEQRIKELTEENERLRGVGIPDNEVYIRLSDAKHAIMEYACNQTVSKYASAEICKAVRNGAEGAMNELDYITPVKVAPIADTVRKMQERLMECFNNEVEHLAMYTEAQVIFTIDQIAKEMLEGANEEG